MTLIIEWIFKFNLKKKMMKKFSIYIIVLVCVGIQMNVNASDYAHDKGTIGITAGVGTSLMGSLFSALQSPDVDGSSTPVINGLIDFGVSKVFSIGGGVAYQSYSLNYLDENYKDTYTCLNIGIRGLFHFGRSEKFDFYTGARVSYTIWNFESTNNDPNYAMPDVTLGSIGVQPLVGISYYFIPNLGINAEAGIGTYLVAGGIKAKF